MNPLELPSPIRIFFVAAVALVIGFAAVVKGAHDLWAATAVYLAVLGLLTIFVAQLSERRQARLRLPLAPALAAIILALALSYARSVNPSESFLELMDWLTMLALFVLAANILQPQRDLTLILALLGPVFIYEAGVVVSQWFVIRGLMAQGIEYREPVGTFVNGNSTVAFCLAWLPLFVARVAAPDYSRALRCYWGAVVAAILLSMALIASTWSVACLAVGAVVYMGPERLRAIYARHRIVIASILALATALFLFLVWYKLALIYGWADFEIRRGAPTSRFEWWRSGLRMWRDFPLTGVGIGNFPSAYPSYKTGVGNGTLYAHSVVIQILAETGLIGLTAVLFFMGNYLRRLRSGPAVIAPLAAGLAMLLVFSLLHVSLEYLSHLLVGGLFLGLLCPAASADVSWAPNLPKKILFAGLALCAVPFIISPFMSSRLWVDGNFYLQEKNWGEAEKSFRSAIQVDDRSWEAYWGLAQAVSAQGREEEAAGYVAQALQRNRLSVKLRSFLP